jgi:hypothetical protein
MPTTFRSSELCILTRKIHTHEANAFKCYHEFYFFYRAKNKMFSNTENVIWDAFNYQQIYWIESILPFLKYLYHILCKYSRIIPSDITD